MGTNSVPLSWQRACLVCRKSWALTYDPSSEELKTEEQKFKFVLGPSVTNGVRD